MVDLVCKHCKKEFVQKFYLEIHEPLCTTLKYRVCSICRKPGCAGREDHRLITFNNGI
jgi:hypothetical protein